MEIKKIEGFTWDYSDYADILHIHKSNKQVKGSIELGDFTLDFSNNDEIVGIEIEHASEFFSPLDIDKLMLSNIKNAGFFIDKRNPSYQLIYLRLEIAKMVKTIPMPLPVAA